MMRLGMFVTATFHGQRKQMRAAVPASAILHLHDRDWVYVPAGDGRFAAWSVDGGRHAARQSAGDPLRHRSPATRVVANALVLQNTVEQ